MFRLLIILTGSLIALLLINGFISNYAWAQDGNDIADVVLQLNRTFVGNQQKIDDRLYDGNVNAIITDEDGDSKNFEDGDTIVFHLTGARGDGCLHFEGTREGFDTFVEQNVDTLLKILFPVSLQQGLTGKYTAQGQSQQIPLSKVFARKLSKNELGGFIEHEWFSIDGIDGRALQGLFYLDPVFSTLKMRYSRMNDTLNTRALALGLDAYPHYEIRSIPVEWLLGGDVFANFLCSWSRGFDGYIGALDLGASIWSSVRKDFDRVRIGTGTVLQISNTYVPSALVPDDLGFIAGSIERRALDWNLTYGMILGVLLMEPLSFNAKIIESHSFTRTGQHAVTSQTMILIGFSYLISRLAPIDIAYRGSMGQAGLTSNSIVLQGNFRIGG